MKRFFILFMVVILSSFVLIGCGSDQDADTIAELQATISDLQNQVGEYSALKTELDSANNSIAELQTQMDALTAEKDEMSAKLEMLYKIEAIDETMYTIADADIYDDLYGEALGNEPTGNIPAEQEIKITGKSIVNDWYRVEWGDGVVYIAGSLLGDKAPSTQQPSSGSSSGGGSSTTPPASSGQTTQPSDGTPTDQEIQDILNNLGGFGGSSADPNGGNGWNHDL